MEDKRIIASYIDAAGALLTTLAHDVREGRLWEGDRDRMMSEVYELLQKVPAERRKCPGSSRKHSTIRCEGVMSKNLVHTGLGFMCGVDAGMLLASVWNHDPGSSVFFAIALCALGAATFYHADADRRE